MPEPQGLLKSNDPALRARQYFEESRGVKALSHFMHLSIVLEAVNHYCGLH